MRRVRITIALLVLILLGIGLVMIYSSSSIYAWNSKGDSFYFLKRHLLYLLFGIIGMGFAMAADPRKIQPWAKRLFLISMFLLLLVYVPGIGKQVAGAKRWIRIGMVGFQPSELVKIAFIVYLADFISRRKDEINHLIRGLLPVGIVLGLVTLLILVQPDLGSAVSLVCIAAIMLFSAGISLNYFLFGAAMSIPVLYYLVFSKSYRRARILAFLNPWADPQGIGFQIIQSQIAIGSGGLFGQGLGQGKQKLFYLPAAHTDFIFSVITEEMGIIGAIMIIALFMVLLWQMLKIVRATPDTFFRFIAIGIVSLIGFQVVVNIGVCIGFFPTKGLPLPFISYGGSSLVANMIALGLLLNISRCSDVCS